MGVKLDVVGDEGLLTSKTAAIIGLPRAPRGTAWQFTRAGLPHSLASELGTDAERCTPCSGTCNDMDETAECVEYPTDRPTSGCLGRAERGTDRPTRP